MKANAISIVILSNGWVAVGRVSKKTGTYQVCDASVIRTWGTTRGLGEIALNGPTEQTILDPCGEFDTPDSSVVFVIKCDGAKWKNALK